MAINPYEFFPISILPDYLNLPPVELFSSDAPSYEPMLSITHQSHYFIVIESSRCGALKVDLQEEDKCFLDELSCHF